MKLESSLLHGSASEEGVVSRIQALPVGFIKYLIDELKCGVSLRADLALNASLPGSFLRVTCFFQARFLPHL